MKSKGRVFCVVVLLFSGVHTMSCNFQKGESTGKAGGALDFSAFVDDYFDAYFAWNPTQATGVGLHQYDNRLEDLSSGAVVTRVRQLKELQERLRTLRSEALLADEVLDAELLDSQIQAELLELETLQSWKKNPMLYVYLPGGATDNLMKRDFAPPPERLKAVVARLKGIPGLLQAMRDNVSDPPREFTDLAIRMALGSVGFFRQTVPDWARQAAGGDQALWKEFEAANQSAMAALQFAAGWLKKDLLPRSRGDYAIGAENFSRKLRYEEGVEIPLDRLLTIGQSNLERDHQVFIETARKIDSSKPPSEVMKLLEEDHPKAEALVPSARQTLESTRQFLSEKKIIAVPSEVRPTVLETPPYARSGSFASMDNPGPYEKKATEAFYYVTPPEKDWDARHTLEHLRLFNTYVMKMITIHEAFPGHYVQFLYAGQFPTKTRKLISCGTNTEGWAHYSEQMMLDEGFGGSDPKLRLAQLSEALLRDCRYIVGIKLHTRGMTVEEGARLFVEKGFQQPANAYEEARRGAYNPTYLYYTLGKLQILKLRDDCRKVRGAAYSLETFHDDFIRQGSIPLKYIRRILLPGNTEPEL
jgi:uncharacterized protein (DUF885 family)